MNQCVIWFIGSSTPRSPAIRPFTDKERRVIEADLRRTGRALFAERGWKKTGIDDLCRAAGIARGTFYSFHPSKEAFFFALLAESETAIREELLATLQSGSLDGSSTLKALIDSTLTVIERHPLLKFAFSDPEEPAPWMRGIEGESLEVLVKDDDRAAVQILGLLKEKGLVLTIDPSTLAGLLRALVLLPLSRRTIGETVYAGVRDSLSAALCRGLS